jgi:hypothetical protein
MGMRELKAIKIDMRSGYSLADLVLAIRFLGKRPMGRFSLMNELDLGEATAKTMMKKLEEESLARKSAKGQTLTSRGERIFSLLEKMISGPVPVRLPGISQKPSVAFVVRGAGKGVRKGIEQRDEGIKHGVDVTTLVFENGSIRFPSGGRPVRIDELKGLPLSEGDAIVVSSGEKITEAKKGGLAVCLTLI